MKILKYFTVLLIVFCLTPSCDDFLTFAPSDQMSDTESFKTAEDVQNAINGLYNRFGFWRFMGRNVIALGDIAADNSWMTGSSGHFDQIYRYNIADDSPDLLDTWSGGYIVANGAAKVIKNAPDVLANTVGTENKNIVNKNLAQAYALKAMSHFYLVNIFGLPYNDANKSKPGIIIIKDEPIVAFQEVTRGTVEEVYAQILSDISKAKETIALNTFEAFTINETSLTAFEARVKLYMGDWQGAITAAQKAIDLRKGAIVTDAAEYASMWASLNVTSEDIFTIAKSPDDNLSANSLNTLYGSYNGKLLPGLVELFAAKDMRKSLIAGTADQPTGLKFQGIPDSKATSNIPVIRLPEMYLIIAEAKAQLGQADAVDFIYEIAKRNPDLKKSDIPTTKTELLKFISIERRKELFQEGHRWFDARRTGELLTRKGGISVYEDWDVSKFVYPIPIREINASGIAQNDGWSTALPKMK
ncbi:RagB/SusD family nutrient uptake outer membrane protein [Petrimonas sp.]|jgi:hypothetical protein|uniref:RagB/SusD family nutrient uptake outer membrane protein n=1 Tax=Petrimonas sp. TaxID=2023866 RepID=UPI000E94DAB1|nr:RagB/SusD family nutrient uptake outer membrane protein [Clostridiales bacterium]HBT85990.1 RagB/SusD family nutrient uptake outer membrane protein [Porphyromonadaceae bacterium]